MLASLVNSSYGPCEDSGSESRGIRGSDPSRSLSQRGALAPCEGVKASSAEGKGTSRLRRIRRLRKSPQASPNFSARVSWLCEPLPCELAVVTACGQAVGQGCKQQAVRAPSRG